MAGTSSEILDDEFVMRRVPAKVPWYDPQGGPDVALNVWVTEEQEGFPE